MLLSTDRFPIGSARVALLQRWTYLLKLACALIGHGRSLKMVSSCPSLLGRCAKSRCLEKPLAPGSGQKKILERDGYGAILIS